MKQITQLTSLVAIALAAVSAAPAQAQVTEFLMPTAAQTQGEQHNTSPAAQSLTIAQGRNRNATISPTNKYSYIGVGGNIGLTDAEKGVGDSGVSVLSKIAVTPNISVRPTVTFGNDTVITVPVTYDFKLPGSDAYVANALTPYVGGGVVLNTGSEENADFLLTSGVDYRFAKNWVGNVGVNVGFADDDADIGVMFGVGYAIPHSR